MMVSIKTITDWIGHSAVDAEGSKIGTVEGVYFDTSTDQPAFITVKVGLMGSARLVLVPLNDATVTPDAVHVAVGKKLAKDAPSIDVDGQLDSAAEPELYAYYGLPYSAGASGERRLGRT